MFEQTKTTPQSHAASLQAGIPIASTRHSLKGNIHSLSVLWHGAKMASPCLAQRDTIPPKRKNPDACVEFGDRADIRDFVNSHQRKNFMKTVAYAPNNHNQQSLFDWVDNSRRRPSIRRTRIGLHIEKCTGWSPSLCERHVALNFPNAVEVF